MWAEFCSLCPVSIFHARKSRWPWIFWVEFWSKFCSLCKTNSWNSWIWLLWTIFDELTLVILFLFLLINAYITSDSKIFKPHIKAYLFISLDRIIVLAPIIPRFKRHGMRNLQYWIRICQKSHNTVTNHNYILCVVRIFMNQTLSIDIKIENDLQC